MSHLTDLAGPIMGRATGFHRDPARRHLAQCQAQLLSGHRLAEDLTAVCIDGVQLEDMIGEIDTHNANVIHGWTLLSGCRGCPVHR